MSDKTTFDVERGFISKLIETKDITTIKECQITKRFLTGEHRVAFQFIQDTYLSTGDIPTVRAFEKRFPTYRLETYVPTDSSHAIVGTEENLKFWCTELRIKLKHNTIADGVDEAVSKLQDFDTEEAYKLLKSTISFVESEVVESTAIDITKNTADRKEAYLRRKENKGMIGIPFGIKHLDYLTKGMIKDTVTTVVAKPGVGKTWFEVLVGSYCMLNNYRVLQLVTEMSDDIMRDRYEAMLFGMCYGDFSYSHFKSGRLSLETEKKYFEFLDNELPHFEPLIVEHVDGVMSAAAMIDKHKPDIVLIDGIYLMSDDQNAKDDWARLTHISRDLKILAKRVHIPFLVNTQLDQKAKSKNTSLGDIKYAQAVGQDSDTVIELYRDELMVQDREMGARLLKQREGSLGKVVFQWDFDKMNFSDIYYECDDTDDNVDEDSTSHSNEPKGVLNDVL